MSADDQQQPNDNDIGLLAANLTTQLNELQSELELLRNSVGENNDAFFNCAMALIIFCQLLHCIVIPPPFLIHSCSDAMRFCLPGSGCRP